MQALIQSDQSDPMFFLKWEINILLNMCKGKWGEVIYVTQSSESHLEILKFFIWGKKKGGYGPNIENADKDKTWEI